MSSRETAELLWGALQGAVQAFGPGSNRWFAVHWDKGHGTGSWVAVSREALATKSQSDSCSSCSCTVWTCTSRMLRHIPIESPGHLVKQTDSGSLGWGRGFYLFWQAPRWCWRWWSRDQTLNWVSRLIKVSGFSASRTVAAVGWRVVDTHKCVGSSSTHSKAIPPGTPSISTRRDVAETEPKGLRSLRGDHSPSPYWGPGRWPSVSTNFHLKIQSSPGLYFSIRLFEWKKKKKKPFSSEVWLGSAFQGEEWAFHPFPSSWTRNNIRKRRKPPTPRRRESGYITPLRMPPDGSSLPGWRLETSNPGGGGGRIILMVSWRVNRKTFILLFSAPTPTLIQRLIQWFVCLRFHFQNHPQQTQFKF